MLPPKPIGHTMKALEQAEKLKGHGDHEETGGNRQNSLGGVERTVQDGDRHSPRGAQHRAQRAGDPAQEAVGRQPARIVEQVTLDGRGSPAWIVAERTGKAAAHPDAVKAACEAGGEYHQIVGHWQIILPRPRPFTGRRCSAPLRAHEVKDPNEEADMRYCAADKGDGLVHIRVCERESCMRQACALLLSRNRPRLTLTASAENSTIRFNTANRHNDFRC